MTTLGQLQNAQGAKNALASAGTEQKNDALLAMADALEKAQERILDANREDLTAARSLISEVMLDRLALSPARIQDMARGIRAVAALPDPVGKILSETIRPNGLVICRTQVPMGVVAIIYESRPNVTSDAAALAVKSGNVCILRCGKEAHRTAVQITKALRCGLVLAGLPETAVTLIEDTSRASAMELMTAVGLVDLFNPTRRQGAYFGLHGQRQSTLYSDRYRYLPCLCRQGGRSGDGTGYRRKCESQPPVRLQCRRGLSGSCWNCRPFPARIEAKAG